MTQTLQFAFSPFLMAVGQVLAALFFLTGADAEYLLEKPGRLMHVLALLAMNTFVQARLRISISENPLAPMLVYLLVSLAVYTSFARLFSILQFRQSLFAGLLFLTADNSAWSLLNSISRILFGENFLYSGSVEQRIFAAILLAAVEIIILAIVRRYLPAPDEVYISKSALVLIVLSTIPFLTIRWFSSQLPAENAKSFQFFITLCFLCQMVILVGYIGRESDEREKLAQMQLRRVLEMQQMQFNAKMRSIDAVNRKYHDMKNLLLYLENGRSDAPEVKRLMQEIVPYELLVDTGCEVVDVLLSEKLKVCQEKEIVCVPYVDGKMLRFVQPLDICTIFGNALDNAIESCSMIPQAENRQISIKTNTKGECVVLTFRNTFAAAPRIYQGLPLSTKGDKENHGFGLKSIRFVMDKYSGQLSCRVEGQEFVLTLLFPREGQPV